MTHHELTVRAQRWLLSNRRCNFALREIGAVGSEIPDAIGWRDGCDSYLVECKASRSDFLADGKKFFRRWSRGGMGRFRYMMCPKDMISPDELQENWGLVYCLPKTTKLIKEAKPQENHSVAEICLLVSALRRVHQAGALDQIFSQAG